MNFNKENNPYMDLNLNLVIPPSDKRSINHLSSCSSNNRVKLLKRECENSNLLFNTFSSNKINTIEKKNNKKFQSNTNINRNKKIIKVRSADHKRIKYYDSEEEKNKDSYLYLTKLKKYYSLHNTNNIYNISKSKSKYSSHSHNPKKTNTRIKNDSKLNNANNYFTINNIYINSKLSMTIDSNKKKNNFNNNIYVIQKYPSNSYLYKTSEISNNDLSEIINTRKKFNEAYNHYYNLNQTDNINLNKNKTKFKEKNKNVSDIYDYSQLNDYWNKRHQDNNKKIFKIKNELLKKTEKEIKSAPKISNRSKELANNSRINQSDNFKFNNIFDKLFHSNIMNNSNISKKIYNSKPKINEKSEKMKRTIDDLYLWNTKRQKKIKENENKIYKKEILKKKIINLTSEVILKERRPFYINKKVEDRLIEQGKNMKLKNRKMKEKCIQDITEQKKYINNNYNHIKGIKSKYMPKEERKNNDSDISKIKKNNNIFNFNYDYNINVFNKRTALFDKNKSNIIKELNDKAEKGYQNSNKHSKTLLLQNYMMSRIKQNKNNVKIKYNVTDICNNDNKKQDEINKIEELKINLNNNYEKNNFSVNKNSNNSKSERSKKEKNRHIFSIKDKRLEDLKKIIDFSDKLYKNQSKINS